MTNDKIEIFMYKKVVTDEEKYEIQKIQELGPSC